MTPDQCNRVCNNKPADQGCSSCGTQDLSQQRVPSAYRGTGMPCACGSSQTSYQGVSRHRCGCDNRSEDQRAGMPQQRSPVLAHDGYGAPDVLMSGRRRSSMQNAVATLASAASVNRACTACCCCVDKLCIRSGLGRDVNRDANFGTLAHDLWRSFDDRTLGPHGMIAAVFHYAISWHTIGDKGNANPPCDAELKEAFEPGPLFDPKVGVYEKFDLSTWNSLYQTEQWQPRLKAWVDIQRCPGGRGQADFSDWPGPSIKNIGKAALLLAFIRVTSGCPKTDHPECKTCCALLMIDWGTKSAFVKGPVCGGVCDKDPPLFTSGDPSKKAIDALMTFDSWWKGAPRFWNRELAPMTGAQLWTGASTLDSNKNAAKEICS